MPDSRSLWIAGLLGRFMATIVSIPAWLLLIAAGMHAVYILQLPAYYVAMHGGDVWAAQSVSMFAAPFLVFCAMAYQSWVLRRARSPT